MGTWGHGIFENDAAADFAADLLNGGPISLISDALDRVLNAGREYLEAPDAEACLAAVEMVAMLKHRRVSDSLASTGIAAWIETHPAPVSAKMVAKAKKAIDRVTTAPSELLEIWEESDDFDAWKQAVDDLRSRLSD